jgi:hypothetical protein
MKFFKYIVCILVFTTSCSLLNKKTNKDQVSISVVSRKIYLPVFIHGKEYSFLLDTGASFSSIKNTIAQKLKLPVVGKVKTSGAHRVWRTNSVYQVNNFSIGIFSSSKVKFVGDLPNGPEDGTLGIDILQEASPVLLDLKNNIIELQSRTYMEKFVNFKLMNKRDILVTIRINNKKFNNFKFDTGGGRSDVSQDLQDILNLPKTGVIISMIDSSGVAKDTYEVIADKFCMGELCKHSLKIMPAGYHRHVKSYRRNGLVGYDLISGSKIKIDFEKLKVFHD